MQAGGVRNPGPLGCFMEPLSAKQVLQRGVRVPPWMPSSISSPTHLGAVSWSLRGAEGSEAQPWGSLWQAKAPNAVVLVVGTHLDLIETKFRVERIATLRAYVLALCRSPSGSRATGFPDITFKHLQ